MGQIKITETILRNTQQSFLQGRMTWKELEPILPVMEAVGYDSIDAWGGSSFEADLVYLNEDPWERLRRLKTVFHKTKIQMTFRGQNMLGYRNYADDLVTFFIQRASANGVDIIRVIDGLNDIRNMETSLRVAKTEKLYVQACLAYTESSAQNTGFFITYAQDLERMGADAICIKDMSGLLFPKKAAAFVASLKQVLKIPIVLQFHGPMDYVSMSAYKALEAGAEGVDTAISTLGFHSAFPSTEMMQKALQGVPEGPKLNAEALEEVHDYFVSLRRKYIKQGILKTDYLDLDKGAANYNLPLGMLYNVRYQLEKAGKISLYHEVITEIAKVRKDCGMPPLVTPFAQIVAGQAMLNVLTGSRYHNVTKEFRDLLRGAYGSTPTKVERMFRTMIIGDASPIDGRPADQLGEEMTSLRGELPLELVEQDEDILTYAQCGKDAVAFFKRRRDEKYGIDSKLSDQESAVFPI